MSGAPSAVVTGGSRGIGLETARALADEGYRVVIIARSRHDLEARAREIGATAIPVACDLGDTAAVERAAADIRAALGGVPDAIVNNAGAFRLARVEATDAAEFRRALDVNLIGPFLMVRAFLADMRARGSGHIVTIGSIADRMIFPENGAYSASKFGARALHEVMRAELRGTGVRATLVSPGPVDTALWDEIDPDSREGFTPRASMLKPQAVADAVRFVLTRPSDVNVDELRLSHA